MAEQAIHVFFCLEVVRDGVISNNRDMMIGGRVFRPV